MLISDGMANQGITDPAILAKIASQVVSKEASISTIGVGIEFNEYLMTTLADHGSGTYHFLENPAGFASIFQEEFSRSKMQAVEGIEISIPLEKGIILTEAAGYPVENKNGFGIFRPGGLLPGQSRTFYITLQIPADRENNFKLENITAKYLHDGRQFTTTIPESFQFSCIQDRGKALASIDKNTWEEKVLQDDINKLREDVAKDIGSGKKDTALNRISKYKEEQESINTVVGSEVVAEAIGDLDTLQEEIQQTFKGAPSAVIIQQKRTSKSLQHKSYEGRRAIQ
jgi:Ca-activated chloride channel family protein